MTTPRSPGRCGRARLFLGRYRAGVADTGERLGEYLRQTIDGARVPDPDERGLMPLEAARAWLSGRTVYAKRRG